MTYELWDLQTGNIVDASDDASAIFALVREYLQDEGPAYIDDLGYRVLDAKGKTVEKLSGTELIARVRQVVPA